MEEQTRDLLKHMVTVAVTTCHRAVGTTATGAYCPGTVVTRGSCAGRDFDPCRAGGYCSTLCLG